MKQNLRRVARHLPPSAQAALRRAEQSQPLRRSLQRVRWGSLRRLQPVSPFWGSERGTPIDRYYIERFMASHAADMRGHILEVRDPQYTSRYSTEHTSIDIVDIDPRNDRATIVADLAEPGSLPAGSFDCAIVPQTLVYVTDPFAATANLWQSLAPGGVLLMTVPAIARIDPAFADDDRWHLTPAGLAEVIDRSCAGGASVVQAHGNPVVAVAFLHGLALEELRQEELDANHPHFPIVVTAAVTKRAR
jgi:SAM-dependent methyltransferase